MTKLYELTESHRALVALAEDEGLDIADTIEGIEGEFQEKAQSIMALTINMDSDIEAIKAEISRLSDRKKAIENRKESIKDYLRQNMEATGISKISCPLFTINCVKGRDIVQIENEEAIPDEYVTVETVVKIRKADVEKALKDGVDVPGAKLIKSKSSIRIK